MTLQDIVISASAFTLALCVWLLLLVVWSARRTARRRRMEQRLGMMRNHDGGVRTLNLWNESGRATAVVPELAQRLPLTQRIARAIRDSGIVSSQHAVPLVFVGLAVGCMGVGAALYVLSQNVVLSIAGAVAAAVAFKFYVQHRLNRRAAVFERQLVDALELAARSLRGGHPLNGALRLVSEELQPPVSEVFQEICQQHDMGASLEESLRHSAENAPTSDMKFFAASVAIQLRSGGNLADMMGRLAGIIRDRMRIGRRMRILTAQTQLSKRVLIGLPVVVFLLLNALVPEYMSVFYLTTIGNMLLGVAAGGLVLGAWLMNRMAVLSY